MADVNINGLVGKTIQLKEVPTENLISNQDIQVKHGTQASNGDWFLTLTNGEEYHLKHKDLINMYTSGKSILDITNKVENS